MSSRLALALPAFLAALMAIGIVLAHRSYGLPVVAGGIVILILLGLAAEQAAAHLLLPRRPRLAVAAFTLWGCSQALVAASAIAVLIYLNVTFDSDALQLAGVDKELMKTTVAAVSALLSAIFIKMLDEADEKVIGERVRKAFYDRFIDSSTTPFPCSAYPVIVGSSKVEAWVFDETLTDAKGRQIAGWGGRARWRRAEGLSAAMADPGEVRVVQEFMAKHCRKPAPPPPPPKEKPAAAEPSPKAAAGTTT